MVTVNFYIKGEFVLTDSFNEKPLVNANYIFNGIKHMVSSVELGSDGSYDYYLLIDNRSFYEANGFHRSYNDNFDPLATYGTIKGFV